MAVPPCPVEAPTCYAREGVTREIRVIFSTGAPLKACAVLPRRCAGKDHDKHAGTTATLRSSDVLMLLLRMATCRCHLLAPLTAPIIAVPVARCSTRYATRHQVTEAKAKVRAARLRWQGVLYMRRRRQAAPWLSPPMLLPWSAYTVAHPCATCQRHDVKGMRCAISVGSFAGAASMPPCPRYLKVPGYVCNQLLLCWRVYSA